MMVRKQKKRKDGYMGNLSNRDNGCSCRERPYRSALNDYPAREYTASDWWWKCVIPERVVPKVVK